MKRRSKYNAKRCGYKGMSFDSILERDRFIFLEAEQNAGRINGLKHHYPFRLEVNGHFVGTYEADFVYFPNTADILTVEDVKGSEAIMTDLFRFKRRVFEASTGFRIHIVTRTNLTELPRD